MTQLRLFEYWSVEEDKIQETFVCWKMIAGVALAKEFVLCEDVNEGWEFRVIPLVV